MGRLIDELYKRYKPYKEYQNERLKYESMFNKGDWNRRKHALSKIKLGQVLTKGYARLSQEPPKGESTEGKQTAQQKEEALHTGQTIAKGGRIAYASWGKLYSSYRKRYYFDIFVINEDGSGKVNLTKKKGDDLHPAWSPDGRKIAFTLGNYDIWVMNADGSEPTNLTHNTKSKDRHPAWSPDGRQIAFESDREGKRHHHKIYIMKPDGSGLRRLTSLTGAKTDKDPCWSPDGGRIAFSRWNASRHRKSDICVINVDSSGLKQLTSSGDNYGPAWSPNVR